MSRISGSPETTFTTNGGRQKTTNPIMRKYLDDIGKPPILKVHEIAKLAKRIQKGETSALHELIEANLRLVITLAKQFQGQGLSLNDLIQEGNHGLISAAQRIDPTKARAFTSYAKEWIQRFMLNAIQENQRNVHIPRNQIDDFNLIQELQDSLRKRLGHEPSFEQLARQFARVSLQKKWKRQPKPNEVNEAFDHYVQKMHLVYSINRLESKLDAPVSDDEPDITLIDTLSANTEHNDDPGSAVDIDKIQQVIDSTLSELKPREVEVLQRYFGLNGYEKQTLEQIGEHFKLTRERVRQIKEKALQRLRHQSRAKILKKYL